MKAMVDDDGYLYVFIRGSMRYKLCKHDREVPCGDWCPLFEGPYIEVITAPSITPTSESPLHGYLHYVRVCEGRKLYFDSMG